MTHQTSGPGATRRTPYNADYGSCLDTHCVLLIYSGALPPEMVSETLALTPTMTARIGDDLVNSLGRKRVIRLNRWELSSEGRASSRDLRHHLDWLIEQLRPAEPGLAKLRQTAGLTMSVQCVWWSREGHGGPVLWPEQMRALAALDLECAFDVYFETAFDHIDGSRV
ncbi:MAG: DUF4279 domain-containing protein [Deltaproteobacteria bacterium]|nr:DUF4279 domain-containing protein [Deltaproteobacteria bacterium]